MSTLSAWSLWCVIACSVAVLSGCNDVRKPKTAMAAGTDDSASPVASDLDIPIERLTPLPRLPAGVMHPVFGGSSHDTAMQDTVIEAGRSTRLFGPGIDRKHQRRT